MSAADYVYTADEFPSSLLQRHQPEALPPLLSWSNARLMPLKRRQTAAIHQHLLSVCSAACTPSRI